MMNFLGYRRSASALVLMTIMSAAPAYAQSAVSRAAWSVHYVDSVDTLGGNQAASNVFDGDPNTVWHTEWYESSPTPPHEIQIDMGASHSVTGFRYLPRQDGNRNGNIGTYQFYVSTDGNNWGNAVATGTFANSAQEKEVTFTAKTGRYVRLRAMTEASSRAWTSVAELNVLASTASGGGGGGTTTPTPPTPPTTPANFISQANWSVRSADSQETSAEYTAASNAIDGDPNTFWGTAWSNGSPTHPHDLVLDLGASYSISGVNYLPRQDGNQNGRVANYQIWVSTDANNWGNAVSSGTLQNSGSAQAVNFTAKTGRYLWFRALSEVNGRAWTTMAELNIVGTAAGGGGGGGGVANQFPSVSLSGSATSGTAVSLSASASDTDGSIARVEFYNGSTRISTDNNAPYSANASNLARGTYSFTAIAFDNSGNSTTSNAVTLTLGNAATLPQRVVFAASPDHDSLAQRYVLEIFNSNANPATANPRARLDLGLPSVVNGQCDVNISALIASLPGGSYIGTVVVEGTGGSSRSAASPVFVVE